jgi:Ca-activated chloride channel homolog
MIHIRENRILHAITAIWVSILFTTSLNAQSDKKYIRKGNREYDKDKYPESEISYRRAMDNNKQSPDAIFNIGDALYKQNKFEEAGKQFSENISQNNDKAKKSAGYFNLGNSLLRANKFEESIEAYKNSLKLQPDNVNAKYNLAYAQDQLKKQQQQQQQQQQQNKDNKDKKENKDNKNKNDQNKDNKDQDKQQNKDNKQNQDQNNEQKQSDKQQVSKEDAERLLNSLANDEKNVQEKVKLAKAQKAKVRTVKNW